MDDGGGGGRNGGDNEDDDPVSADGWPEEVAEDEVAEDEDDGRRPRRRTAFNQCHMSVTQFGFFGLALAHPEWFGLHGCRRRDLEDFVHLWRTIGYYTGVADEYNFGRGTVDEVADRSRWLIRTLVVPRLRTVDGRWEHMCRCATEGLRAYMRRAMPFDAAFCYLCDVLGLDVPRFRGRLGWAGRIRLWWTAFMMRYAFRCGWFKRRINRLVLGELKRAAAEFGDERAQDKLKSRVYFDRPGCGV